MDGFLNSVTNRIDAKGRVSIPAPFRAVLAREGTEGLYCLRNMTLPCVDAGGAGLYGRVRATIDRFEAQSPFSEEFEDIADVLLGASETVKVDPEGRFVVADWMRETAALTNDVTFVGKGYKFQLWSPQAYAERRAHALRRAADLVNRRGERGLP